MQGAIQIDKVEDFVPLGEALSALGVGVTLIDRDMRVHWANQLIQSLASELSCGASHCFSSLWKSTQRCPDCLPLLVFRTGEPQEGVRERALPGGAPEAYRVRAVPVLDGKGELRWVVESLVQLSHLMPSLAGGRSALAADAAAASGSAFIVIDAEERIVSWNPAATATFGYALEEILGRRLDQLVPPDRKGEERELAARVAREGRVERLETVRLARDGRRVPVALSAVALHDEAGALVGRSCVLQDLSSLHQLRGRIKAQEELIAHITREAADAIVGVDGSGKVTSWNRGAEQLLGISVGDMLGRPLATVAEPRELASLLERASQAPLRGERMTWRDAGGEPVPVDISAAPLRGGGLALVARDLSARLRLDREMIRSEKLAVVGSLAAGLAHEIGTPLNVISATAEYLMLDSRDEPARQRLREIVDETERISRLVRELLTFARGSREGRVAVPIREAVDRVLSLLRIPLERKGVHVETEIPGALPAVCSEPDGLHQILLNLLMNAMQAVPEGGRVGLRVRAVPAGEGAGPAVCLEVHDDGPGVPEPLRERIFDPFFTTRPDGTGLGLAVCARVVASHGGDLRVVDGPLGGACFVVQLPAVDAEEPCCQPEGAR